jgi:putative FmdB family regulatory protein
VSYNPDMPVYEYQCAKCGERFEIVSNLSERDEKAVCPVCGGRKVSQVFGGFRVGISRTRLNPGVFERKKGQAPKHKPPLGE